MLNNTIKLLTDKQISIIKRLGVLINVFVFCLLFLTAFIWRFWELSRIPWKDENISLKTLNYNPFQNPLYVGVSTNPPLFYYLIKVVHETFVRGYVFIDSSNIYVYRLVPLGFSLATLLLLLALSSKESLRLVPFQKESRVNIPILSYIVLVLFGLSPLQTYYAAELRSYTLTQFLFVLQFIVGIQLITSLKKNSDVLKNAILILLLHLVALFTNFSQFIFFVSLMFTILLAFVYLTYFGSNSSEFTLDKKVVAKQMLTLVLTLLVGLGASILFYKIYSANPKFSDSITELDLGVSSDSIPLMSRIDFYLKNPPSLFRALSTWPLQLKEVISFYYWFGFYYFHVDTFVQVVFKKLMVALFLFSFIYFVGVYTTRFKTFSALANLLRIHIPNLPVTFYVALPMFLFCMLFSLIGDVVGVFPFGGRHIMPFSFLLYLVIAGVLFVIFTSSKIIGKVFVLSLLILLVTLFVLFNYCSLFGLPTLISLYPVHGNIFNQCLFRTS